MASLAKYRHAFAVGLQSNLVYRWNFAIRGTFSLFHLVVVFLLWSAAYAGRETVGGFSLAETMTYFIATLVVQFFIGAFNEDYQVSEEIRNGLINQFLTKPINYFLYRLSIFVSARLVSGALVLVPLTIALPLLWDLLAVPQGTWLIWHALPSLIMAAMIQFSIAYCFGLLTFWFLEIQSFVILSFAIETLFAGQVFPLDLLPPGVYQVVQYLPYPYQMYFPVALLTGRITDPGEAMQGLAIQAFWVVALVAIAQVLWSRGLRRHTAVGG